MNLPSPDDYYGEIGLREMISRLPPPINWWHSYLDPSVDVHSVFVIGEKLWLADQLIEKAFASRFWNV